MILIISSLGYGFHTCEAHTKQVIIGVGMIKNKKGIKY